MSIKALRNKLNQYLTDYPEEKSVIAQTFEFLDNNNCFNRSNLYGHFTGSAWIVDESNSWALMTHHKKLNKWLQLGGHADGNQDLLGVAYAEALEESGFNKFKIVTDKIFDLDIHSIPKYNGIPRHFHFDVRFLLKANRRSEKILVSNESKDVAWIKFEQITKKNDEESIKRMLHKSMHL
ncbi:MAG: NUDIX hydrolase [Candidatus Neomarinimicrobiota bacterium]|nr:NUDIX hydrolase [Candidatus Neomarinimicrobiota bacterium]|tara:strand:- start:294 stop:833 length:540 start_codon:yes stop_codon:yes gene_type:complete